MIEQLQDFPDGVLGFVCHGTISAADYQTVLVPAVAAAARAHRDLRLYYQVGSDVGGFEAGAMWEDFKVGMGHLFRWHRVAVVTDVAWIRQAVGALRVLMPGAVRVFPLAEAAEARAWVAA